MKSWRIQRQNSSYTTKDLSFCQLASQLVRQQQAKSAGQLAALWWVLPNIACFYSQVDGLDHFTSFCTGYCQTLPQYSVVILSIMKTFCDTGLQTRSTSKTIYPYCSLSLLLQSFKEHVAVSTARLQVYKRFHGRPLMWELEFTCLFLPVKQIAATYFFSAAKNPSDSKFGLYNGSMYSSKSDFTDRWRNFAGRKCFARSDAHLYKQADICKHTLHFKICINTSNVDRLNHRTACYNAPKKRDNKSTSW